MYVCIYIYIYTYIYIYIYYTHYMFIYTHTIHIMYTYAHIDIYIYICSRHKASHSRPRTSVSNETLCASFPATDYKNISLSTLLCHIHPVLRD